jgi:hypothetical protein
MGESSSQEAAIERGEKFKAEGTPLTEHILNIIKAGLSTAPFTGGIASLMTDYIPAARVRRLEQFAEAVANDLRRLQDKVKSDYLVTDDFAFMFERTFRAVAENPQREKLEAFRGILVNSAIRKDLSEEEKEYFLNLAMNLSTLHIRIVKFMAKPDEYLAEAGIPKESIQGGFGHFFPIALPGIQLDVIRSAFADLYRYGLTNTDETIFGTMTAGQGLELLGDRVSKLGNRFIQFCSVPHRNK